MHQQRLRPSAQQELSALDEALVDLVRRRSLLARQMADQRRSAGLPAAELAEENRLLRRYGEALGRRSGGQLALLLLELSRSPAPACPGSAPDEQG